MEKQGSQKKYAAIPLILYGTAWKEDSTESLVFEALQRGYRGIDTANQRKHYYEEAVGRSVQKFLSTVHMPRSELFLQSKFTSLNSQDERLPYDKTSALSEQVQQSFTSTLAHFNTHYLDSFILHGPSLNQGINKEDLEIWRTMEFLANSEKIRYLGVSNVNLQQLEIICQQATIKPTFVQNRCFAINGWDWEIRQFCNKHSITYQGFSLLTANAPYIVNPLIKAIASKYKKTIPQIIFRFAVSLGMLPLTGTTKPQHMQEDLKLQDFELNLDEIKVIETIAL